MTPFAAIDFETANCDAASACSLGIVAADADGSATEWHRLIRPPAMRFLPAFVAIHGIRPEDVEDKPEFPALWPEIASLLRGRIVFAHNAQFDMGVLGATLDRYDLPEVPFRFGCTARLARHVWAGLPRHSLDVVTGALGFSFRHHDALDDARACAFIVRKALERSGTDDVEAMMKTQRQRLHAFRVARSHQDYGLCGELLGLSRKNRDKLSRVF